MLEDILDAIIISLKLAGIDAFREYPERRTDLKNGVSVCVGFDSCRYLSSGMGEFLGIRKGDGAIADTELFGRRLELSICFEIFSPFGVGYGASGCVACADSLRECITALPSGIKALEMACGEISADDTLASYRCVCTLRALAFLVAENDGGDTEFLDFVLKGTVDSGN